MKIDYQEAEAYIRKAVVFVLGDRHPDLDDVVQNSLIRVFNSREKFRGDSKLSTWVRRIAHNQAKSLVLRKDKRTITMDNERMSLRISDTPEPEDIIEPVDQVQLVMEALPRLSKKVRLTIQGTLEGKSSEELCEELGVNENALYRLRGKGKKRLRQILGRNDS